MIIIIIIIGHGGSYPYLRTWTIPRRFHEALRSKCTVGRRRFMFEPPNLLGGSNLFTALV